MRRPLAAAVVLAMTGGLGAVVGPAAADEDWGFSLDERGDDAPRERIKRAGIVTARQANLTDRPDGYPTTSTAARNLASAKVRQDIDRERVSGTFVLRAAPTSATSAYLYVAFGHLSGSSCDADVQFSTPTNTPSDGFSRSRRTITFNLAYPDAGWEDWDCAFAALTGADTTPTYDVLINELSDVYLKPSLRFGTVKLLGAKRIKLVPGVWTNLDVVVRNTSRADAPGTVITGRGKGIRVRTARVGKVWGERSVTQKVSVKLTRKRTTRIRFTARTNGSRATTAVRVRPRRPPAPPKNGRYESKDGRVDFRIRNGRVVGFRTRAYTRCGGYPDLPTYSWNYYDFPTVAIPRNGIVDRRQRRELYGVGLQMFVNGGNVSKGRFWYSGPNRCFASSTFSMRRG